MKFLFLPVEVLTSLILVLQAHPQFRVMSVGKGFLRTFTPGVKSARSAGSSSARAHPHSSSWTLAAYLAEEMVFKDIEYEFFEYGGGSWVRRWLPSWAGFAYRLIVPDGSWHGALAQVQWDLLRRGLE